MNTYAEKAQENKSQSTASGTSQNKQSGGESTFQFVDNRPDAVAQGKLQDMANDSPQASQLWTFQEMVNNGPQAIQLKTDLLSKEAISQTDLMHFPGHHSPVEKTHNNSSVNLVIQRKEEADLKVGVFNMIGETHTDYRNDNYRKYESSQIKEKLGLETSYFTESQLKTDSLDQDFSDPLDLRVEQLVAFVKNEAPDLVSRLKSIKLDLVTTAEEEDVDDTDNKAQAVEIVKRLIPSLKVEKSEFNVQSILDQFSTYSPAILNILKESDVWSEIEDDSDNGLEDDPNFSDNAIEVQVGIDDLLEPKEQTEEQEETQKAFLCFMDTDVFFEKYKGRVPGTLKLYYELKSNDEYSSQDKYDFSINEIPPILDEWKKLNELLELLRDTLYKKDFTYLKTFIEIAALKLENIVKGMLAGAQDNEVNTVEKVVEKRSIKMHEAAEALADENIAWKVGNLHIKDIQKLESEQKIPETNYAYITKENFKSKNFNAQAAEIYAGDAEILDETAIRGKISQADQMIEGHRDGLKGVEEKVNASEEYKKGYLQGQKQRTSL